MEKRNITITIEKAREWYNSGNEALKEVALQAFEEKELIFNYRNITTFKEACRALSLDYSVMLNKARTISVVSKASSAMFVVNIVRKALNLGQDLHLTREPRHSYIHCPYNPIINEISTYFKDELESGKIEIIGKIRSEEREYYVLGGDAVISNGNGLGSFLTSFSASCITANNGFLGCASEEIAKHLSKYFGMLITEAKFGDIIDFEIIENYTQK